MAFKNLEDQFNATMNQLYGKYSTGDTIEYKPNNPNKESTKDDTRMAPIGSILRDEKRISTYLISPEGIRWLALQEILQSGNSISETRDFNPLFINANLVPYIHLRRSLRTQKDDTLTGDNVSPGSLNLGKAGRLQKETANDAQSNITISAGTRSLIFSLLSPSTIVKTLANIISLGDGTLGINERPELDFQGNYYSVLLWKGYDSSIDKTLGFALDALSQAGAELTSLGIGSNLLNTFLGNIKTPTTSFPSAGVQAQKYFISSDTDAVRYLKKNSMLSREPFLLTDIAITSPITVDTAENEFQFPERSLEQRYTNDDRLSFIREQLQAQVGQAGIVSFSKRGIFGGLNYQDLNTDPGNLDSIKLRQKVAGSSDQAPSGFDPADPLLPRWYHDSMNEGDAIVDIIDDNNVFPDAVKQDFIKVAFEDTVNSKLIPFRAILSEISEVVTPTYTENKYIGRLERNIVFQGATRALNFTLTVVAFSPDELQVVWERINYLTGLAYPSKYTSDGYMVPGLVKLTIGDYYIRQPGYIGTLTHNIDQEISWELVDGQQVPQAIEIAIQFNVIEKFSMEASSSFYGFGVPTT